MEGGVSPEAKVLGSSESKSSNGFGEVVAVDLAGCPAIIASGLVGGISEAEGGDDEVETSSPGEVMVVVVVAGAVAIKSSPPGLDCLTASPDDSEEDVEDDED